MNIFARFTLSIPSSARKSLLLIVLLQPSVAAAAAALAPGFYTIEPPTDGNEVIVGASDSGAIAVGESPIGSNGQFVLWDHANGSRIVPLPAGDHLMQVCDISADGSTVVGWLQVGTGFGPNEPFRWTPTGGFELLGTISDQFYQWCYPNAVSDDGSVVVGVGDTSKGTFAFRWTSSTGIVNLGAVGNGGGRQLPTSYANDLSADGSIIVGGTSTTDELDPQTAYWTQSQGWTVIGSLPGDLHNSTANAVSGDGSVIVGFDQGGGAPATIWSQSTGLRGLPGLSGYATEQAYQISDDASVALGQVADESGAYAVAWFKNQGYSQPILVQDYLAQNGLALNGFKIWNVYSVSPDGRVLAGTGYDSLGRERGFVAVLPDVPEPTSATLLLAGAVVLIPLRSCRRCS